MLVLGLAAVILSGCGEDDSRTGEIEPVVRGLKSCLVDDTEKTTVRRYPSVLQPSSTTTLSFEVTGRLKTVNLDVGQRVSEGDIIAEIDPKSLQIQVDNAKAAVRQAEVAARNAEEDFKRKSQLLEDGVVTKAQADQSETSLVTSRSQETQARKQLENAEEDLSKAVLRAPFNGIINTVDVESFTNVTAGTPVATVYADENFESSFTVSFDVVNRITVGKKAAVRLADDPSVVLSAHVSELGSRADTVSSFPVVVILDQTNPLLKAGMAVEITLEFAVPKGVGFTVPLTVLPMEGRLEVPDAPNAGGDVDIFVYDEPTSTVKSRKISVGGLRENELIVVDGLQPGERVACAGVAFLRDGMKVNLLPDTE
jgi:RND family efflux transporter MFP subunit